LILEFTGPAFISLHTFNIMLLFHSPRRHSSTICSTSNNS